MFYLLDYLASKAEDSMSLVAQHHRQELKRWGDEAGVIYRDGDVQVLSDWLEALQLRESTAAAIVSFDTQLIVEGQLKEEHYKGFNFGRSVDWPIHLYFQENPVIEVPLSEPNISFLVRLPDRMRPGSLWNTTRITLQILLPMALLAVLALLIYRHIMRPLGQLQRATHAFSGGELTVRALDLMGNRNDELSDLASTFDRMAERIGEQIVSQRQLIADLSHELRTPLTRLDIAVESARSRSRKKGESLKRVTLESQRIRRLVEDALNLAWLENERPEFSRESLDLVDLIDVLVDDASFEFPDRKILTELPESANLQKSNHRALGQAVENILRNAMRFTPEGETVIVVLEKSHARYVLHIKDRGPGVPGDLLEAIFKPFFRVDKSRSGKSDNFGLGLALARRQLQSVGASVSAENRVGGGLCMSILLPQR